VRENCLIGLGIGKRRCVWRRGGGFEEKSKKKRTGDCPPANGKLSENDAGAEAGRKTPKSQRRMFGGGRCNQRQLEG